MTWMHLCSLCLDNDIIWQRIFHKVLPPKPGEIIRSTRRTIDVVLLVDCKSHLENKIDPPFEFEVLIFFESSIFFNLNMWVLVKGNGKKVDIWIGDSFFFNRKIMCPQYFYNTFTTNIYIYIYISSQRVEKIKLESKLNFNWSLIVRHVSQLIF